MRTPWSSARLSRGSASRSASSASTSSRSAPSRSAAPIPRSPGSAGRTGGARGVVTHSSGNHGQAVAFAAERFGIRAVDRDAGAAPAGQGGRGPAHGGEVVLAGATRSAEQGTRAEAIARGGRPGHDSAVRGSRRDRRPGHLRPRDPRAAARRRDHPGAGGRRRAHRRHLRRPSPRSTRRSRSSGSSRPAPPSSPPRWPPAHPRTLEHTESLADGLLSRVHRDADLRHPARRGPARPSR